MGLGLNDRCEALSGAMVRAVAAVAGVVASVPDTDRISRDFIFEDVDSSGLQGFPTIAAQLKSTTNTLPLVNGALSFPLKMKNYNELRIRSNMPAILILAYLPGLSEAAMTEWMEQTAAEMVLRGCLYWRSLMGEPDSANRSRKNVRMPIDQPFTPAALVAILDRVRQGGLP